MSMGYGGVARFVLQDELTAIYEYAPYNLNYPEFANELCCETVYGEKRLYRWLWLVGIIRRMTNHEGIYSSDKGLYASQL